jgi:hypothetical protein
MANRYSLGIVGGSGTSGVAQCEFRAGSTDSAWIREIGVFLNAATASTIGLGRPANDGSVAGGTVTLGQTENGAIAAVGGIVTTGWSTSPTAPTNFLRRMGLPAAIGNGIIWTWPNGDGLFVAAGRSLVIWNLATNSVASIYFVWEE